MKKLRSEKLRAGFPFPVIGSVGLKILVSFGGFPCPFPKNQGKDGQGKGHQNKESICVPKCSVSRCDLQVTSAAQKLPLGRDCALGRKSS